jgi:hypothetical protein
MSTPMLHIYGQAGFHDDVWVVGDREALTLLADAVNRALAVGRATTPDVFCSDGEGYAACVRVMQPDDADWRHLAMPYTAEYAQDLRGEHPEVVFQERTGQ